VDGRQSGVECRAGAGGDDRDQDAGGRKTPGVSAPAAPAKASGEKEVQETKAEQKAEKAQFAKEKGEKEVAADPRSGRG